jgi:PAS domain S-box-containing protein
MDQNRHRLLARQLKKNVSTELLANPEFQNFISVVNDAYNDYDTEYKQLERMFELSSKESFKELSNIRFALDQVAAVFVIDSKRIIRYVNDNFCKITSFLREEVMNKDYLKFLFSSYHNNEFYNTIIARLIQGLVWKGEIKINDKNNLPIWTSTTIVPLLNNQGKIYQFLFISIDITERKNAEEELRKLSLVADKTDNAVVVTDALGRIEWVNKGFTNLTEYSLDEVVGKKPGNFLQGENTNPNITKTISEKLKTSKPFEAELLNYTKSGKSYWVNLQVSPIVNENGQVEKFISIQLDITRRKEYEKQLILLEQLIQHTSDIVQIFDRNGNFTFINETGSLKLGYSKEEVQGMNINQIELMFKDKSKWDVYFEQNLKSSESGMLVRVDLRTKNGELFPVEVQANYVEIEGQEFVVALSRDITSRLELENKQEETLQNFKVANQELNDFAYIVSHDLKAPLRAIGSLVSWLKTDYVDKLDEEGKNIINLLEQRTHRMYKLIEGVLNYSKIGRVKNNIIIQDTNEIVKGVIEELMPSTNFKFQVQQNLPVVQYENVKYGQVFQNLISNAIKYNDKEIGIIRIGVTDLDNNWEFYVEDNGPGIEEQYTSKIFQIFQTLKPRDEYESTGIGLSIVKKIVELNGGFIRVESEVGKSCKFCFTVPKIKNN